MDKAVDAFEESLKLAFEMHNAGRTEEAEALCRTLEQIQPKNSQLLFLLGMVLHKTGQNEEAVKWLRMAAEYNPKCARIFNGLGCAYQALKDHPRAVTAFEKAIELGPESGGTYYNLGTSCYRLDQVERAAALFRRAAEINPADSESWNNLGKCLKELNRLEESIAMYTRAVEVMPDYTLARYGRAVSLLTAGRLVEGFQEYECRWHAMTPRKFPQPAWHGEHATDKMLFIHAEQGFGDAIQMARFAAVARERVAHIILECRPELKALFQFSKLADTIIAYGEPIPAFDYFIPSLSLPHALGIRLETIPKKTPYLQAPAQARLLAKPGSLKVGLAWAGNPRHYQDAARSMSLPQLAPVLAVPGVAFYSLQQSPPSEDSTYLRSLPHIHFNLKFADFLETASAISELDLVISVDTAVAHLAGALGKPVWTLVQHSPDWRWFLDRSDTPWYPTMKLFRQAKRNHWEEPVAEAAKALQAMTTAVPVSTGILPTLEVARATHGRSAAPAMPR